MRRNNGFQPLHSIAGRFNDLYVLPVGIHGLVFNIKIHFSRS